MDTSKPCPVCGSTPEEAHDAYEGFYIRCTGPGCGLFGPTRSTQEEAREVWNSLFRWSGPEASLRFSTLLPSKAVEVQWVDWGRHM